MSKPRTRKYKEGVPCFKQCGFVAHSLHEMYEHYKAEPSHKRPYSGAKLSIGFNKKRKHLSVVGSKVNGSAGRGYHPSVEKSFEVVINHLRAEIAHNQDVLAGLIAAQKASL